MKVVKNEFVNALKRVMPGIATGSSIMEGADSFVFHKGNVYTYNSNVSVMTPVNQELNLEGTVKAEDFYNCIQKMPDDFEIEVDDKVWVLKCGKIKVKVNLLTEVESVIDRFGQLVPSDNWIEIKNNEFHDACVQCNMPQNKTQYSGLFVDGNIVISSDGLQINKFETENEYPTMWLSNSAISEILKWNDFTKLQLNKTWLQFTNGSVVFSVKTLFNDSIDKIVDKINGGLEKIGNFDVIIKGSFNDEVYNAIDRAKTFSESVMNRDSVIVTFDKNDVVVSAKRVSGEFNEAVDIGTTIDEPVSFALDISMIDGVSKFYKDFELISVPNLPPRLLFKNEHSVHLVATLKM